MVSLNWYCPDEINDRAQTMNIQLPLEDLRARPRTPTFGQAEGCVHVGQYRRTMPVTMARMMENALDWEHLPTLHANTFSSIDVIESGPWGWRAAADVPNQENNPQIIELLLDAKKHQWVSTIVAGPGEGNQIHTQAIDLEADGLEVVVDFFVPDAGYTSDQRRDYGNALSGIYATLYDEDEAMMARRQVEMDAWAADRRLRDTASTEADLGTIDALKSAGSKIVSFRGGRYRIIADGNDLTIFSVRCPHMLGPLDDAPIEGGTVTCPWHGYRFDVRSGQCVDHKGLQLEPPPEIFVDEETGTVSLKAQS